MMDFGSYDVRIIGNDPPEERVMTPEKLMNELPWLARKNARGANIFIGPTRPECLIFLDDRRDGLLIN